MSEPETASGQNEEPRAEPVDYGKVLSDLQLMFGPMIEAETAHLRAEMEDLRKWYETRVVDLEGEISQLAMQVVGLSERMVAP